MSYTYRGRFELPGFLDIEGDGFGQSLDLLVTARVNVDPCDGPTAEVIKVEAAQVGGAPTDITGLLGKNLILAIAEACREQDIAEMRSLVGPDYQQQAEDAQERLEWALMRHG